MTNEVPSAASAVVSIVIAARNPGACFKQVLDAVRKQELPNDGSIELVVVDDGSTLPLEARTLASQCLPRLHVLRRSSGGHRGEARNAGVAVTSSPYVLFLDADCIPAGTDLVASHLRALEGDQVASCGMVHGDGPGFWHKYQTSNASLRARRAMLPTLTGTAANLMVRRDAFLKAGGFDPAFSAYGFEDRDLLARLVTIGPVTLAKDAVVKHCDSVTLAQVIQKLSEAGERSAPLFRMRHPAIYRHLGYAAIDAKLHPRMRPVARTFGKWVLAHGGRLDPVLNVDWIPFGLRRAMVKVFSALAFLFGTTQSSDHLTQVPEE